MSTRSESARRGWQKRKETGWQPAAVAYEQRLLEDLREAARQVAAQARFGRDLHKLAEWCVSTCLAGGASVHTAYFVAGEFTKGLADEWSR